ncbi:MAG TPA: PAS domain-containing protein [Stellaceae bacterium]|nr:PAS domain-containing protein [Stellaceae bacterium]
MPPLTDAFEAWRRLRRDTPCPRRSDFDPLLFRGVLGMLSLLEVFRDPMRFRYRIHGTETARWLGYDLTGKFIDEGANKVWIEMAQDHLSQVANTGRPALERHFNTIVGHRNLNVEALVLPLATDGHAPDFLISILIPHSSDPLWKAQPPRTERFLLDELAVVAR